MLQFSAINDNIFMPDINNEKAPLLLQLMCFSTEGISDTQNLPMPQRETSS